MKPHPVEPLGVLPMIGQMERFSAAGKGQPLDEGDLCIRRQMIASLQSRRVALLKRIGGESDSQGTTQLLPPTLNGIAGSSDPEHAHAPLQRGNREPSALGPDRWPSIFGVIRSGVVSILLEGLISGIYSADALDDQGSSPLHVAAAEGRLDMIRVLLEFTADPSSKDRSGNTPADIALRRKHTSAFRLLSRLGGGGGTTERSLSIPCTYQVPISTRGDGSSVGESEWVGGSALSSSLATSIPTSATPAGSLGTTPVGVRLVPSSRRILASKVCSVSDTESLVVIMVGLPGRGKSFISKRICRHLNWIGVPCRIFNAGDYRRKILGVEGTRGASFFDPHDQAAAAQREAMAEMACADLFRYIEEHGAPSVGILDATNTTASRRQKVVNFFRHRNHHIRVMFVESVCDAQSIIRENILRAKCGGADYRGVTDVKTVIRDFEERIENYAKVYEPLSTDEGYPFVKLCNIKEDVIIHKVRGGIPSQITYLLLNLFHLAFPVYLTMPGETVGQRGVCGPDDDESLTETGIHYCREVAAFIRDHAKGLPMTILHGSSEACRCTVEIIRRSLVGGEPV
jgi:hypothetical protein